MTDSEQHASIGLMTLELGEAKRKREALRAELRRHAEFLKTLGGALLANPESVAFPVEPGEGRPTVLQLQNLVRDLREANARVEDLTASLGRAGIRVE